ncbi:MAG: hypothetical protein ACOCRX_10120 [Candidatus Woesearchaeota archaeon]
MGDIFELPSNAHIHTAFGDFYAKMREENIISNFHQLFTYAFLVGLKTENMNTDKKTSDIMLVQNINDDNLAIIKGIALMSLEVEDGKDLLDKFMKYADGGIEKLKVDYENDGKLSLQNYIE